MWALPDQSNTTVPLRGCNNDEQLMVTFEIIKDHFIDTRLLRRYIHSLYSKAKYKDRSTRIRVF